MSVLIYIGSTTVSECEAKRDYFSELLRGQSLPDVNYNPGFICGALDNAVLRNVDNEFMHRFILLL